MTTTGTGDQYMGSAKETVGNLVGNERLQAEGKAQNAKGVASQEAAKAGNRAEAAGENVGGMGKQVLGAVTGNDSKEAEGRAQRAKADVKDKINQ
ncbi:hypothetical protein DFS34DRAFT_640124 [Phlyctochytrium arcticum]|nr:hypothetical protein DFS34DRAFT_640124 [Phlyctochytrium arcticum]